MPEYANLVRALLGRFPIERGADLTSVFGPVDGMVVVPSTDRPLPHSLANVLTLLDPDTTVLEFFVEALARWGSGDLTPRHTR